MALRIFGTCRHVDFTRGIMFINFISFFKVAQAVQNLRVR